MIVLEIRCDECQTAGMTRPHSYAHQLRQALRRREWKCTEAGGKDYCPKCKPRGLGPTAPAPSQSPPKRPKQSTRRAKRPRAASARPGRGTRK